MPRITIDGVTYYYTSTGPVSGLHPALVLLHGSGGDSTVWHAQTAALAVKQRVIAVDLPGHGRSGGKAPPRAEHSARWLRLLAEALALPAFVLAGHSMGGCIAQQFAHTYPGALAGLILVGTGLRFDIPAGYLDLIRRDFDEACMVSCRQAYAGALAAAVIERGRAMLHRNGPDVLERDLELCAAFDGTARAHCITVPCLILCGEQDTIAPRELSERLAGSIPGSFLASIGNAGHMVMQEQPERFNRAVADFIATQCRSTQRAALRRRSPQCPA